MASRDHGQRQEAERIRIERRGAQTIPYNPRGEPQGVHDDERTSSDSYHAVSHALPSGTLVNRFAFQAGNGFDIPGGATSLGVVVCSCARSAPQQRDDGFEGLDMFSDRLQDHHERYGE